MQLYVHEVFQKIKNSRSKSEKIKLLKDNNTGALRDIIRGSMDENIEWWIPDDPKPPHTPSSEESYPSNLVKKTVELRYIVKGSRDADALPQYKRENIYIGILESIHPKDVPLVIDMICKKPPSGVTRPIVEEAFPGLLTDSK